MSKRVPSFIVAAEEEEGRELPSAREGRGTTQRDGRPWKDPWLRSPQWGQEGAGGWGPGERMTPGHLWLVSHLPEISGCQQAMLSAFSGHLGDGGGRGRTDGVFQA